MFFPFSFSQMFAKMYLNKLKCCKNANNASCVIETVGFKWNFNCCFEGIWWNVPIVGRLPTLPHRRAGEQNYISPTVVNATVRQPSANCRLPTLHHQRAGEQNYISPTMVNATIRQHSAHCRLPTLHHQRAGEQNYISPTVVNATIRQHSANKTTL